MDIISNDCFNDYPIDYFKFNESDFNEDHGEENFSFSKEQLEVNDGYILSSLSQKINFNTSETIVVNCGVGQGKTAGILHIIKEYLNREESIDSYFIIAVPLVSLVSQYVQDLYQLGFPENHIFSYQNISDSIPSSGESYLNINCRIHVITVNTLLGNPGEDAVLQSQRKYNYIKTFASELASHGKNLCILYDEIHEAIGDFSPIGIAYMAHFSSSLYKNIVLSATFNVQSIPVIKLLAKQTQNKIRILEAPRNIDKEQSELFLHYDNDYSINNTKVIEDIIDKALSENKVIDILSYSKKLCKELLDTQKNIGSKLYSKFGNLRDCTSSIIGNEGDNDEDLNKNRFDNNFCNIGTNFKSGVNIIKENHCFIVILPAKNTRSTYKNYNGIFSEGINAVIQSIARQRKKGEIHIILPKPIALDF